MKKRWIALFLMIAMLVGLTACGAPAEQKPPAEDTVSFTDDAGRTVAIPASVTRIVPSSPLGQMLLFAVAPDMLVGLASELPENARDMFDARYYDLPVFGSLYSSADLNVEELALTAPQLIVDIGEEKDSVAEDMDALQAQTGIPSVFVSAALDTMPEAFRTLGELLGREEKGEELARFCERVYTRTLSVMDAVGENRVSALYVLGEKGLNVLAAGSYHAEVLDLLTSNLAVVENPVSKGLGNEVTMEQIALWDPAFVLFGPGSIYEEVESLSVWGGLSAIENGDYVLVPDTPRNWMGMPPSVQRYLGLIWLTYELYPDYCDYDVRAEIMEYYRLFYGCELTDAQYEAITAGAFRED